MAKANTIAKVALPLAVAAGLGLGCAAAISPAYSSLAPTLAWAAASAASAPKTDTQITAGPFSLTVPDCFEEMKLESRDEDLLAIYKHLDEENGTGQLLWVFTSSELEGYCSDVSSAQSILAMIPALVGVANDSCKLDSDVYKLQTGTNTYLYFALASDSKNNGGAVFLAADKNGKPLLMFMNGVTDTDAASLDYYTQMAAIANSFDGGVEIKGLASNELDLNDLVDYASSNGSKSDKSASLSAALEKALG